MKVEGCVTDLLDDGFEPPLGAHQCDGSNDFSMENSQSPVLPDTQTHSQLTAGTNDVGLYDSTSAHLLILVALELLKRY